MKQSTLLVIALIASCVFASSRNAYAREDAPNMSAFPTGISLGFQLHEVQNDFGLGAVITSPTFLYDRVAVRLRGCMSFLQHTEAATNHTTTTWTPYFWGSASLVGFSSEIAERIRLYGEGGIVMLFPSEEFSNGESVLGGMGLFGFEFFIWKGLSYTIELGGMGVGAKADKIPGAPIYSNGFAIMTGFRGTF